MDWNVDTTAHDELLAETGRHVGDVGEAAFQRLQFDRATPAGEVRGLVQKVGHSSFRIAAYPSKAGV
jgi:hypothetical protein